MLNKSMGGMEFITLAQKAVARDWNENVCKPGQKLLSASEVYPVFLDKNLQNNKGTFATPREDKLYYEVTRNGDKNQLYVDRYSKHQNTCIQLGHYDEFGVLEPSPNPQIRVFEEEEG